MPLFRRVANLFIRSRVDREIDAELEAHIALRIDDNLAAGMTPEAARRDALMRFGNPAVTRERVVAADAALGLDGIAQDLRFALRQLRRSPGFTLTAVLTLAMAIGANAVVFSILNGLILRPLDVPGATDLENVNVAGESLNSYADYRDLRDRNQVFDGLIAYNFAQVGLNTGGDAIPIWVYEASGNYFDVLGVKPYLGRFFQASDEHGPNSNPYVVLSYAYWRSQFHADPQAVGRVVQINRHPFTILGVAQPRFRGTELFFSPALWAPIVDQEWLEGANTLDNRRSRSLWIIGRLKPHLSAAQIQTNLDSVAAYLRSAYPSDDDTESFSLTRPGLVGDMFRPAVRAFVIGLMMLAGLILLAACANLGGLFTARASDRASEIALRLALGSSRKRILRQLLVEAMLISFAGGLVGIGGSLVLLRGLNAWQPLPHIPVNVPVNPDIRTYAMALLLAVVSGFLFGIAPIRQIFGAAPWEVVKTGTRTTREGRFLSARDLLLVVQITLCAVLMTSSLVAVRGLMLSLHSSFGFAPEKAILVETDLTMAGYKGDRVAQMQRRMLQAVTGIPEVQSTGMIDAIPLGLGWSDTFVYKSDVSDFRQSNSISPASTYNISPGYLQAAGTTLLAGRSFQWQDDKNAPKVALVNRAFAEKVYGSIAHAIGGRFKIDSKELLEIVGVVEDGKYKTLTEDPRPVFYRPLLQSPSNAIWQVVRTRGDPELVTTSLRETLRSLDPALPCDIISWQQQLDTALFPARAATISLGVLGALGAMLAITGIFGMASYSVGKRLKEMGIRIALGASHGQVLHAALGRAFRLLAFGSLAGLGLGLAATRILSYIVYQATPHDPAILGGTLLAMLLVGLIATWAPARRALGVNPSKLMREE